MIESEFRIERFPGTNEVRVHCKWTPDPQSFDDLAIAAIIADALHTYGTTGLKASQLAERVRQLNHALGVAIRVCEGLSEQQAMPNDWYVAELEQIRSVYNPTAKGDA